MYNAKDFGLKKAMVISTHLKQFEEAIKTAMVACRRPLQLSTSHSEYTSWELAQV